MIESKMLIKITNRNYLLGIRFGDKICFTAWLNKCLERWRAIIHLVLPQVKLDLFDW